ncbi:MAG: metalloregulator ArsR/SmtB family transcription factor [Planctomycetes bacterium]|nr:metalloregulator ArsR/SmtB family transcription factor [Planctomycetota bacterium]
MNHEIGLFRALADLTRLRLAVILAIRGDTCVCLLGKALGEPDYKISRHLSVLRSAGMVENRREGTWMHYRLVEPRSLAEEDIQKMLRGVFSKYEVISADLSRIESGLCSE